jgi:aryl-alcohol dehydrogenase-like predicted oxidoreductase
VQYRHLGRSGLRISAIGLGCNPFGNEVDQPTAEAIVSTAVDLGVTYFDTADSYFDGCSENYLGRALAATGRRQDVILATKFGNRTGPGPNDVGASRRHIMDACEASLRRLRTDVIDVYQVHSPDRQTPIQETLEALDTLVRAGKVRYIGCSNFFDWEVVEAQWIARTNGLTSLVACQDFFNLLYRDVEKRTLPMCEKYGLGLIPYMPLAAALLSGAYRRGVAPEPDTRGAIRPSFGAFASERNWTVTDALQAFAAARGWALPQLAIAWLLTRPMVPTVIAGADRPEHLRHNIKALDVQFSEADLAEIDQLTLVDEDRSVAPIFLRR